MLEAVGVMSDKELKLEEVESSVPLYLLETFFLLSLSAMGCYLQPNERRDEPGGILPQRSLFAAE